MEGLMTDINTDAIQTAVNKYLDEIGARERKFYADSAEPSAINRITGEFKDAVQHSPLEAIFGFVPVFLPDLSVEIYARFGGPEIIQKMSRGSGIATQGEAAYGMYAGKFSRDRRNTPGFKFGQKYKALRGDTEYDTLYNMTSAYERDLIQRAVVNALPENLLDFVPNLEDIRKIYKFKLVPNVEAGVFDLYYSDRGAEYALLKRNPEAYSAFGADLILDALDATLVGGGDFTNLVQSANTVEGQTAAIGAFLGRFADDFNAAAMDGITYGSNAGLMGNADLDQLWYAALTQLVPASNRDWAGRDILANVERKCSDSLFAMDSVSVVPACRTALSARMESILAGYALAGAGGDSFAERVRTLQGRIANLESEAEGLREQIKTLESGAAGSSSLYTYAGVVAGAGAAYLSVKDRDLETWHMAAAVVAGGVLGAIPVVNFATIALTPLIAEHTAKALQGRQNPIRVPAPYVGSEDD
jgi:hypothetical protein